MNSDSRFEQLFSRARILQLTRKFLPGSRSLARPVTAAIAVVLTATALGIACCLSTSDALTANLNRQSEVLARNLSRLVAEPFILGEYDRIQSMIESIQRSDTDIASIVVIGDEGEVIASTRDDRKRGTVFRNFQKQMRDLHEYTLRSPVNDGVLQALMPIKTDTRTAMLEIVLSKKRMTALLQGIQLKVILGVLIASLISASVVHNVAGVATEVRQAVDVLGRTVDRMLLAIADSLTSSKTTADFVHETTATTTELKRSSEMVQERARAVLSTAQRSHSISAAGSTSTRRAAEGMVRMRDQIDLSTQYMVDLSTKSKKIGQIIETVDDLARRSGILSINAAIEAAKAQEYGKGFDAVAREMRDMAFQSKAATKQVRDVLREIQSASDSAARGTDVSVQIAETVAGDSNQASDSIAELAQSVSDAARAALDIATASEQQSAGADQVVTAMLKIQEAADANVTIMITLHKSGETLMELGNRLREMITSLS